MPLNLKVLCKWWPIITLRTNQGALKLCIGLSPPLHCEIVEEETMLLYLYILPAYCRLWYIQGASECVWN